MSSSAAPRAAEIALVGLGRFPGARDPALGAWLAELVAQVAPGYDSFAVRFVGDPAMRALNLDFRALDKTTDVLSFPGEHGPDGRHLGDVVISVPTAKRQAESAGHPLATELRTLLLHGVLHCLGHDHESDDGEMERLERRLRRRFVNAAPARAARR